MTAWVPLACALIVALYVALRLARAADSRAVAGKLALVAAAAFVGEDTMVRFYGHYGYGAALGPVLDRVPVLVPLIWAVVIDSASELAALIAPRRRALAAAAIVLCDASLIEPVAVRAGLWSWVEGGLFDVPFVGLFGWAIFTAAVVTVAEHPMRRGAPGVVALVLVPAAFTHAGILASWWCAFRWLRGEVNPWIGVAVVWALLPLVAASLWKRTLRKRVPRIAMLVRVPGALFFYVLLVLHARHDLALVAYCVAFAWPYLALVDPAPSRGRATVASC